MLTIVLSTKKKDNSFLSNHRISRFGGLIRNNDGNWLLSFIGFCGIYFLPESWIVCHLS